jgi:large subunit ribosomal protein L25
MTDYKINAKIRTEKAGLTRQSGFIPAVIYGSEYENENISLEKISFLRLYKEAGTSNLIELAIDDKAPVKTLVHDIQYDPLTSDIIHIDFFKVNMKEKIHAEIPLKFIGDSVAVIEREGTLITPKTSIEVECLPADLIPELEVDISILDDFEKDIRISDLKVPAGIEIQDDPEEVIAHVEEPRSDEELAELEEEVKEDVEAVEVEHAGEAPAEGEEGAAPEEKPEESKVG